MASQLQIDANRRNATKSTGPRSPEGKAVSRFNALKSGIHAEAQVVPGEDAAELQALTEDYHRQFQPATPLACFLVDSLIRADWQLRRLHLVEAQLWASHDGALGETYTQALDLFTRLQRRIDSTERSYYRALNQLQRLQADSSVAPLSPQPLEPAPESPDLASFHSPNPAAAAPDPAPRAGNLSTRSALSDAFPIDKTVVS